NNGGDIANLTNSGGNFQTFTNNSSVQNATNRWKCLWGGGANGGAPSLRRLLLGEVHTLNNIYFNVRFTLLGKCGMTKILPTKLSKVLSR
ncbi:hypothetical protein, partial [uncultured Helicobacter sp.]